ncbi:transcriptional regulator [Actinopolyspora mortivallis]|uniref:Transcriptional regulator n=1 Tax=Actinopolyspora mortivallis TaxID=33906 RepID=A0A2T0GZJ3_ACTMO|nr:transcriptional regulator [Actinopolyspora mortivallis]
MSDGGSVVRRWQLAAALKALREDAGIRQERAVELLKRGPGRWSRSKLSRIENREHTLKPREVEQILDAYGVTDVNARDELVQLANESAEQGWWVSFNSELPEDLRPLLSIESGLVAMRDFQNQLIHGLLQTSDYARALINAVNPGMFTPEEVERRIAARMTRQQVVYSDDPPRMHFIMDQGILERPLGTPRVMRDQLCRLLELTEHPNITIQVLSKSSHAGPGLEGPFSILTLPDPIPDIGYTEGPAGSVYIEEREHVRTCTLRFGVLTELALSPAESVAEIDRAMKAY